MDVHALPRACLVIAHRRITKKKMEELSQYASKITVLYCKEMNVVVEQLQRQMKEMVMRHQNLNIKCIRKQKATFTEHGCCSRNS